MSNLYMTRARFYNLFQQLYQDGLKICATKGKEYADEEETTNALNNFRVVAELVGISPLQVGMVYLLKHILALCTIAKSDGKTTSSESIESRITDVMVYAALFAAIVDAEEHAEMIESGELPF